MCGNSMGDKLFLKELSKRNLVNVNPALYLVVSGSTNRTNSKTFHLTNITQVFLHFVTTFGHFSEPITDNYFTYADRADVELNFSFCFM